MKAFKKLTAVASMLAVTGAMVYSFGGAASASCLYQYNGDNTVTSSTPVFNSICGVPNGIGDESQFVRLRQNTTGDDTSSSNNSAYVHDLSAACNDGDTFDVHTYIHNDAESAYNDNGNGSAVAHNEQIAMQAPLNTTASKFNFTSTISASNAASVTDTGTLSCNGPVKLTLVPQTVKVFSGAYGWAALSDSAVNGSTKIGSQVFGSGDQWGCWNYRMAVVYEVKVQKIEQPPVTAQCTLLSIAASEDRKVTINNFTVTSTNATLKNVAVNWGDNTSANFTSAASVIGQSHTYANEGTYVISAVATFTGSNGQTITSGGTGTACAQQVTFKPNQPPTITTTPPAPTQLVNTGAGSTIGLFAAVAVLSAAAHRWFLGRRLSRQ